MATIEKCIACKGALAVWVQDESGTISAKRCQRCNAERKAKAVRVVPSDVLREVARIAHEGGIEGLGVGEALIAIRKLTLPFWTAKAVR